METSDYSSDREQTEGASSRAEIQRSLGRIEGQLTSINSSFIQHMQDDAANFKEINLNIAIMQKKIWTYGGFIIAAGFIITHADRLLTFIK